MYVHYTHCKNVLCFPTGFCYEFYVCPIETMVHVDVIGHQGRLVLDYNGLVNCHIFQRTLIGTIFGIAFLNILHSIKESEYITFHSLERSINRSTIIVIGLFYRQGNGCGRGIHEKN